MNSNQRGQHVFSQVPRAEIPRSQFDRSSGHKTTFDAGILIPYFVDEVLPGDTFSLRSTLFARLATPIKPVMDNMYIDTQFFFVPNRLVWDNWQKMCGEQEDPGDSTDFTVPQIISPAGGYQPNSIYDYLGLPVGVAGIRHNALYLRACNLVWNQWYRDQNLQASLPVPKGDGPDLPTQYTLQRRAKRHDYFTSCLPWPQKNNAGAVEIPLGISAPVVTDPLQSIPYLRNVGTNVISPLFAAPSTATNVQHSISSGGNDNLAWSQSGLITDLTQASAATINSLRQAFQLQRMFERDARGGTRYTEVLLAHFGVSSPDARLQRAEYLGGGSSPVSFNTVPQQSPTGTYADTPQGNLSAYATAGASGHGFTKSFTEHGMLIGFVSVRADLNYQQGLNRMWSRETRFDYAWPGLTHIGEQAVLSKEILADATPEDDAVFGYQERYAEYRYRPNQVTGEFRSSFPQSLDYWHLAQDFTTRPLLNESFIVENPPVDRIIAVPSEPHFLFDSHTSLRCSRPLPLYGVPGFIDHF
ncbi:MAG: major capsid protein [Microvirus sp.]|nr:MAG: major capsid protein [Microvirus sp.]